MQYNNNTYSKERTIEFVFTSSDYSSQIQKGVIEDELVDYVVLNLEFNYASSLVETYAGFYTVENMPTEISTDIGTITIE